LTMPALAPAAVGGFTGAAEGMPMRLAGAVASGSAAKAPLRPPIAVRAQQAAARRIVSRWLIVHSFRNLQFDRRPTGAFVKQYRISRGPLIERRS